jgi:hypothetical protein
LSGKSVLSGSVKVALWHGSILEWCRREKCVDEAVLVNKVVRHDPEYLGPDFTDCMDTPVTRLVKYLVR